MKPQTATQDTYPPPPELNVEATTEGSFETRVGVGVRWREYRADRKRRVLVQWLRRTANRALDTDPIRRHREALLHFRAAAVRADLLAIAATLERTQPPNPACLATLHKLLSNGSDSPLYNPNIDVSELHRTIDGVRAGLRAHLTHAHPEARTRPVLEASVARAVTDTGAALSAALLMIGLIPLQARLERKEVRRWA
jgi:hypothetical protein